MPFEVFRAVSEADRTDVFRFRYAVYVEEMGGLQQLHDIDRHVCANPPAYGQPGFACSVRAEMTSSAS